MFTVLPAWWNSSTIIEFVINGNTPFQNMNHKSWEDYTSLTHEYDICYWVRCHSAPLGCWVSLTVSTNSISITKSLPPKWCLQISSIRSSCGERTEAFSGGKDAAYCWQHTKCTRQRSHWLVAQTVVGVWGGYFTKYLVAWFCMRYKITQSDLRFWKNEGSKRSKINEKEG